MKIKPLAGLKDLPSDLMLVLDASANRLKFGVTREGFGIFEPRLSTCGRLNVDPSSYGLTDKQADAIIELNKRVDELIEEGLNASVGALQGLLGVKTGDWAGQYFSGKTSEEYSDLMIRYVALEIRVQRADMTGPLE